MEKRIKTIYAQLEKQLEMIDKQLDSFPTGHLLFHKNGKYMKYYISDKGVRKYLHSSEKTMAEKMAYKAYLKAKREDLANERQILMKAVEAMDGLGSKEDTLLSNESFCELLADGLKQPADEYFKWANDTYQRNEGYPESLKIKCLSGDIVRSKSESFIDNALFLHKIPFRYECALYIDSKRIFPDFTIKHPETGKVYLWEHFGLIENLTYAQKFFTRIEELWKIGFYPSINLIMTFETEDKPLDSNDVEKIVQEYFM